MIRGIYTAASGMVAESLRNDVISNNLANANTAGFKKDVAINRDFATVLIDRINDGPVASVGEVGSGVQLDEVAVIHSGGAVRPTGNDFDMAIDGNGYFTLQTPNGIRYTRNGSFTRNGQNELVDSEGNRVLGQRGPIRINGDKMTVSSDGQVMMDGIAVDRLRLAQFQNENQLTKEGNSLYIAPAGVQARQATGQVEQGYLEQSNVNVVSEMVNLINGFRAYEINSKSVQTEDQMLDKAVNEVGKV